MLTGNVQKRLRKILARHVFEFRHTNNFPETNKILLIMGLIFNKKIFTLQATQISKFYSLIPKKNLLLYILKHCFNFNVIAHKCVRLVQI